MPASILFVDFENVHKVDLSAVPADVTVPFFFGASQNSVTREFHLAAHKLGPRYVPIEVAGQGKNALDFHIAFYLGEYLAKNPTSTCIILSKDKGFDPLVTHLQGREFQIRRVSALAEAFGKESSVAVPPPDPRMQRAITLLAKVEKKNRPRKRARLAAHLATYFQNADKVSDAEIDGLIDRLISTGRISESKSAITYHF